MEKKNGRNLRYSFLLLVSVFTRLEAQSPIFNRQYQLFPSNPVTIYGSQARAIGMEFDATNRYLYLAYETIEALTLSEYAEPHIKKIDLFTNTTLYDQNLGLYQTGSGYPLTGISVSKAGNVFTWGDFDVYGSSYAVPIGGLMDDNSAGDFYVLYDDTAAIMKCNTSNISNAIWKVNFTNAKPTTLDIDTDGSVYVFGRLTGGTFTLNGLSVSTTNGGSFFMAKFRPNGTCVSLVQNTVGSANVWSTRILPNHEILLGGTSDASTSIGATSLSAGGFFTARMDTLGNILSASHIGPNFAPTNSKYSIEMDSLQNVYVYYNSSISKYSATGSLIWGKPTPLTTPSSLSALLSVSNGGNFGFGFNFNNPNYGNNTSSNLTIDGQFIYNITDGFGGPNNDGFTLAWASVSYNAPTIYPVVASFIATENQCGGGAYSFDNHSSGATSYSWNFGDPASGANNTSTQIHPSHTFSQYGQSYNVSLTATGAGGTNTSTQTITVSPPWGLVTINPTPAVACMGDSVALTITMLDYQWCGNYFSPNFYTGYGYGCSNYVFFDLHDQNYNIAYSTLDSVTATGQGTHATYMLPPGNYTITTQNQLLYEEFAGCGFYSTNFTIGGPKVTYNSCSLSANVSTGIQWFLNGIAVPGATSQTYVPTATGNYSFSSSLSCLSDTLAVTSLPVACATSASFTNTINCLNVSFSNTSTGNGALTYSWDFGDGSPIYVGVTPPMHTYAVVGAYAVQLTANNVATCSNCTSMYASTVNVGITFSTSTPIICTGGLAQLNINGGGPGSTYSWQVFSTANNMWIPINLAGYTGGTITSASFTLVASQQYRVIYNTPCGSGITNVVNVTVIPDPTVTISSSSTNLCVGTNTTLTATLNGGTGTATYQWQENVGGVYNIIPGATSNVYTTANLTTAGNKYYKVIPTMTGQGCNLSGTGIVLLTVKALPSIAINPASPSYCVGGSVSIAAIGGTSYSWSPATNLSVAAGTPVLANPAASTTYSLTGAGSNGCSKTIAVPVTVNPDPSISISGNNTACLGGTATFTATSTGGAGTCSLVWQRSTNGTTWTNISGVTGNIYTTPALATAAYYRATYVCTGGGCSPAAVSNSINVTLISPITTVLSTINSTVCTGGTASLSVNAGINGTTYSWQQSTNSGTTWTNIIGYLGTTNTTYTSPTLSASISYRVIGISACKRDTTAAVTITVVADPVLTVSTSGNNFCIGNNPTLTATITNGTGTATYQWQKSISGVYTNILGATNGTYTPNVLTSGNNYYKVLASMSGAGCGVTGTGIILLTALALPNVATSPASPTYCIGGSQSIVASGASIYSWSPATNLSAATGTPVIASPQATTSYTLTGTGTNGCVKTIIVPVTVTADPSVSVSGPSSVPTGTIANLIATVTGGAGTCTKQWQSSTNGTTWANISGATGTSYTTPAITGTKYYRASYNCTASGCSPIAYSNVLAIIGVQPPARMEMPNNELSLSLFPNPADVKIIVHLDMIKDAKTEFAINNILGESLMQWQGQSENGSYEHEISIENLATGVYFLTAKVEGRTMIQKFVKE